MLGEDVLLMLRRLPLRRGPAAARRPNRSLPERTRRTAEAIFSADKFPRLPERGKGDCFVWGNADGAFDE